MMALGALAKGIPVTLVPIGMNYFHAHQIRSKVFVDVGHPILIEQRLVTMYKEKDSRREACSELLEKMTTSLEYLCLTAPDFATLKILRTARRLYQNKTRLTTREYLDLNERFSNCYKLWRDRPEIKLIMSDIGDYLDFCRSQDLKDKQVRDLPAEGSVKVLFLSMFNIALTLLMTLIGVTLGLGGILLYLPIILYSRSVIPSQMEKALYQ